MVRAGNTIGAAGIGEGGSGSVQEVQDFCRDLIDDCGKDGGFILANMPIDHAKPENVKAMIDFTREYGVYR